MKQPKSTSRPRPLLNITNLRPATSVTHKSVSRFHGASPLRRAHTSLSRTLQQLQEQVRKMHELRHAYKITPLEAERFCCDLELINSTLRGWFFLFEEAARRPSIASDTENRLEGAKKCSSSSTFVDNEDATLLFDLANGKTREAHALSDSPLVQGIGQDRCNFFSPTASKIFFEDLPPDPFLYTKDQSCKKDSPFLHTKEQSFKKDDNLTTKHLVFEPSLTEVENFDTITGSKITRSANGGELNVHMEFTPTISFTDSKLTRPVNGGELNVHMELTPTISFLDHTMPSPAMVLWNEKEGPENMELVTPQLTMNSSPTFCLWSAKEHPENMELVTPQLTMRSSPAIGLWSAKEDTENMELVTPLEVPQSLLKKYSKIFTCVDKDPPMELQTHTLISSPPRSLWLMSSPHHEEQDITLKTPMVVLSSPFRTPGLFLGEPWTNSKIAGGKHATSIIKNGGSAQVLCRSSEYGTPLLAVEDLGFMVAVKPGCPQPGEQTLKRELWERMEAVSDSSIADVCKSLFPESASGKIK